MDNTQEEILSILGPAARNAIPAPSGSLGWSKSQCLEILERLKSTKIAVLSGECLRMEPIIGLIPAHDGWTCMRAPGETAVDYASRSRELARHKIDDEAHDELLIVLDLSDQREAA